MTTAIPRRKKGKSQTLADTVAKQKTGTTMPRKTKKAGTKKAGKKKAGKKKAGAKQAGKKQAGKKQSGKKKLGAKKAGKKAAGKGMATRKKSVSKKPVSVRSAQPKIPARNAGSEPKAEATAKQAGRSSSTSRVRGGGVSASGAVGAAVEGLRRYALSLPETYEEFPWDHSAIKVRKKVFVFLPREGTYGDTTSFTVKLPRSGDLVLTLPIAQPTGYGLGRSGWVTVRVEPDECPPLEMMCEWVEESYMAIAPKSVLARRAGA